MNPIKRFADALGGDAKIICQTCGSEDVETLWLTRWNPETGERELICEHAGEWTHYCNECQDECAVRQVVILDQFSHPREADAFLKQLYNIGVRNIYNADGTLWSPARRWALAHEKTHRELTRN